MKNPILVWVYKFLKEKKKALKKKIEEHQATQSGNTLTWSYHKFHFDQVIQVMMIYTFTHLFHIVVKLSISGWTIGLFNISFTNSEYTFCLYISGLCSLWQRCIFLINFDIFLRKIFWIVYFSSPFNEEVILWRLEMMLSLFKGDNIPEIDSTPSFDQVLVTFNIYFQIYPYFQYKVHKWTVVSKFQNSRNCGFSVVASAEDGGSPGGSLEGAGGGGSKVSWPLWRLSCWQWGHWNVYVGHHTVIVEVGSKMALLFPPFGGLTLSWEEYFCCNWSFLLCSCVSHQLWPWILSSYPVLLGQFFLSDSLQELNSHPSFEAFVISESLTLCKTHPEHGTTLHHLKTLTGDLKGAFLKRPSQFSTPKRKTAFWYQSVSAWLASKRKHSWPLYFRVC